MADEATVFVSIGQACRCCTDGHRQAVGFIYARMLDVFVRDMVADARPGAVPLVAWPAFGAPFEVEA